MNITSQFSHLGTKSNYITISKNGSTGPLVPIDADDGKSPQTKKIERAIGNQNQNIGIRHSNVV